jgi:tRNA(fMet)-specific endonuclease VapC
VKILDTDHCIAILRGSLDLGSHARPDEELAVTAISVGELTHGAHKSQRADENLARLDVLLSALTVLPYGGTEARYFGQLKAELQKSGEIISDPDLQIASIALEAQSPLLTHNLVHFERLAKKTGLHLEDWVG